MALTVLDLHADPTLALPGATVGGSDVRLRVHSGLCVIGWDGGKRPMLEFGAPKPELLGFYVPEAGPLAASWSMTAWAELSVAQLGQPATQRSMHGTFGVDQVSVQLVDDRERGGRWAYLWFVVHGGEPLQLRYRVMVTEPSD